MSPEWPVGTEKYKSSAVVVPLEAGQSAAVIVHVFGVPVQPAIAVFPAASDDSSAPVISDAPAVSEATAIVTESNCAAAVFAALAV